MKLKTGLWYFYKDQGVTPLAPSKNITKQPKLDSKRLQSTAEQQQTDLKHYVTRIIEFVGNVDFWVKTLTKQANSPLTFEFVL